MESPRDLVRVPLEHGEDVLLLSPSGAGGTQRIVRILGEVQRKIPAWPVEAGPRVDHGDFVVGRPAVPLVAQHLRASGVLMRLGDRLETQARSGPRGRGE